MNKPTVFISYSHKDEVWKDRLLPQLKALEQAGRVTVWDDRKIDGGDKWYPEIKEAMERAAVAVCLITPDYLASHFCVKEEVPYLLERCENDGLVFIPLLARPCTWLERLAKDNYRGARRVFAWSFYSQGTSERATSADQFINAALEWFGDEHPMMGSPWDKGERLAQLARREKTLLLLDGMEPLQSPPAYERGKVKDPALATLVEELARENNGLCVITTRETIADLNEYEFVVPPSGGSVTSESDRLKAELQTVTSESDRLKAELQTVRQINLELLSPEAGRALLRVGDVRGTDEELERATEDFGRHALALNLLAAYLQDIPGHHISAAAQIPDLDVPEAEGRRPRRLIAAFEQKFGEGPEVEALRLLGLFDRPADGASIAALREAPIIPGLTDHIQTSSAADWLRALQRLRKYKLIAAESHHDNWVRHQKPPQLSRKPRNCSGKYIKGKCYSLLLFSIPAEDFFIAICFLIDRNTRRRWSDLTICTR